MVFARSWTYSRIAVLFVGHPVSLWHGLILGQTWWVLGECPMFCEILWRLVPVVGQAEAFLTIGCFKTSNLLCVFDTYSRFKDQTSVLSATMIFNKDLTRLTVFYLYHWFCFKITVNAASQISLFLWHLAVVIFLTSHIFKTNVTSVIFLVIMSLDF